MAGAGDRQPSLRQHQPLAGQLVRDRLVQRGDAVVVEARRNRAEHRQRFRAFLPPLAVALVLLAHVAQRVLRALAVEFVDRDEVGEVEHVDLLELRRGAELGCHHVQRDIDVGDDRRVALPDAGRLDDNQVEARHFAGRDDVGQRLADLAAGVSRRQRAHVDARVLDRIHPDPVAEQRAAGLPPRRIDRDDRDPQPVLLVEPEAADDLVGQRALAGAAGAGDAERRRLRPCRGTEQVVAQVHRDVAFFESGDHPRKRALLDVRVLRRQLVDRRRRRRQRVGIAGGDDLVDHPLEAELLARPAAKTAA
jgi:hypothetical protein